MRLPHFSYGNRMDDARTKMRMPHGEPCEAAQVSDSIPEPVEYPELATTEYWRRLMRRARQDADLSQGELATRIGISQAMLSRIESGDVKQSRAVVPIASALGIPLPQFATGDELDLRWQQAGGVLKRRDHAMFVQHLELVESLVAKLSQKP
jgi:ribosome-binding protein aMBF1 (putative translation factor)